MRALAIIIGLGMAIASTPSEACVYPSGFDQDAEVRADMSTVTSIYEGRIDNVRQGSWSGAWNFTVRPIRNLWGRAALENLQLTAENGACSNYHFLAEQDGDAPEAGTTVIVFSTPKGQTDGLWTHIARADGPFANYLFRRFGETPAGRNFDAGQ